MVAGDGQVSPAGVARLAVPALGVLAAEPLYVLLDTVVVGHLGAVALGGLALAGLLLSLVSTQLTFLSYGTTARSARLHGANRRGQAVGEGVQATWLALLIGIVFLTLGELFAAPVVGLLSGGSAVADAAVTWLRIALLGTPMILVTLAGNGWMRGVQDTARPLRYVLAGTACSAVLCPVLVIGVHWGLAGSAVANVAAQYMAGALFLRALAAERAWRRPSLAVMWGQLKLGRDLVLRSLAFQACFLSATTVAAHTSTAALGAHQIVIQLWNFLTLVLDSLAIAAQAFVGADLGAERAEAARRTAWQLARYGLVFGLMLGALFAALAGLLPALFTADQAILAEIPSAWWFFVALQPLSGVVFALDGVLLGAGDARFLRTATLLCAALGFLPLVWLAAGLHWGLPGIWAGLAAFMLLRLVAVTTRTRSPRWAVTGAGTP
ncbi:MAG: MATE family efflux transporter [Sciscionella sp.]